MLRSSARRLATIAIVMMLLVGVLPFSTVAALSSDAPVVDKVGQEIAQPIVVVNTAFQNIRSGPGPIYTIVGVVPGASELPVVGRNSDTSWWQVESPFGIGWIYAEYVVPRGDFRTVPVVEAAGIMEEARVVVLGATANVYVYPDESASLLGMALTGSELPLLGQTDDGAWWLVETNVGPGWTMQEGVAVRGDAASVPVVGADAAQVSGVENAGADDVVMPSDGDSAYVPGMVVYAYNGAAIHLGADSETEAVGSLGIEDRAEVVDMSPDGEWVLVVFMGDHLGWVELSGVAVNDPAEWRTQVWRDASLGALDLLDAPDAINANVLVTLFDSQRLIMMDHVEGPDGGWFSLMSTVTGDIGWTQARNVVIIKNGPYRQSGASAMPAMADAGAPELSGAVVQASALVPAGPRSIVIINTGALNVRSGPGAQYTVVATFDGGVELESIGQTPDTAWFKVNSELGIGWVNAEFVIFRGSYADVPVITYQDAMGQPQGAEVIVSAPINVYLTAGVEGGLLGTAPAGLTMEVNGRTLDGTWLRVVTTSGDGWVLASTVTFQGDLGTVPVIG